MAARLSYKEQYTLEQRRAEVALARQRHPNMIPVILENGEKSRLSDMPQKMFFVPFHYRVGNFANRIRTMLNLDPRQLIFLSDTNNGRVLEDDAFMSTLYVWNKDEDGALYIEYSDRIFIAPAL